MTVGVYAFATQDYKEKDYPLDLWLEHNLLVFDQIAVAKYDCDFPLPVDNKKVIQTVIKSPERSTFRFFRLGKQTAMRLLSTDWKVLLDIDEFVWPVPDFDNLDKTKTYRLQCRALWGSIKTEIVEYWLAHSSPRVHFGDVPILRDGEAGGNKGGVIGQFWHTNGLRTRESLFAKWAAIRNDFASERLVRNGVFPTSALRFEDYSRTFPNAYLRNVCLCDLPKVLAENRVRFNDEELRALRYGSLKELCLRELRIPRYLAQRIKNTILKRRRY
ncbi:MAG: hypothetical protein JRN11_08060 [Nitrososphaerota archaeon]|nr:hypothetical protein [Nitrososphaerota archaeon]MDG7026687.1 hypothetical protein [Nitrososphaerota archaeon]